MPVREPDPVSVLDTLMLCDPLLVPVVLMVMERLLVMLEVSLFVGLIEAVIAGVPVRDTEPVLLPV